MIRFIKKHKLLSTVMILLIVVLITQSLIWFFAVKMQFIKWADTVGKTENSLGDLEDKKIEGDYIYFVKQPRYLRDNGFVSVGKVSTSQYYFDDKGVEHGNGTDITLYIWYRAFSETKYGIMIVDPDKRTSSYGYGNRTINEQLYVDASLNYIPYDENDIAFNEFAEKLINDNYDECKKMMDLAKNMWDI